MSQCFNPVLLIDKQWHESAGGFSNINNVWKLGTK